VVCTNVDGIDYHSEIPFYIDRIYSGTLLSSIFAMPMKKPIQFDDAVRMAAEKFCRSKIGHNRGENLWYIENFVEWMSELGFHIELTGDEFETIVRPQTPA
jgi:hypothetical protein